MPCREHHIAVVEGLVLKYKVEWVTGAAPIHRVPGLTGRNAIGALAAAGISGRAG
jgi:hypothetical protein